MNMATRCVSILLLGFFFVQGSQAQVNVEVEFRVNMGVQLLNGGFDPSTGQAVTVTGTINGWAATADTLRADFLDPNIYTGIVQLDAFTPGTINFKFTTVKDDGAGGITVGWEGGADRALVITGTETDADGNGYLDASFPAAGQDAPFFSGITFDDVFSADTEVVVEVDLRPAFYFFADSTGLPADVQTGDPVTSIDGLFANGPFASPNGWEDWGATLASIADLQLVDDGTKGDAAAGDSVYTFTLSKKAGDAKRNVDLKFGINGFDNESTFAGNHKMDVDEANPTVSLVFSAMRQSDGTYLDGLYDPYVLIDNTATPPTATAVRSGGEADIVPVDVEIEFSVNMGVQLLNGEFDPAAGATVSATGTFNGWTAGQTILEADFLDPNIYTGIVQLDDFNVGQDVMFKFTTVKPDGSGGTIVGWEGGADKRISIRGDEPDTDGNGYIDISYPPAGEAIPFFSGVTFDDIFTADTEVLIQVDARPAFYHLADSSGMPADVQTGDPVTSFDGLFANGPFASPNGWEDWGANLAAIASLQLVDDGTNGDAVAGDTVFTMTLMKTAGQAKRGVDLKFGVNGFDNESTFAGNHVMNVDEANPVVNLTFGAMLKADGTYEDSLYDPYIYVDNLSTPPSAIAVRRGGENDMVATNTRETTLPETVVLSQNYPNPFNPVTTIEYELANSGRVTLQVFDLLGRNVATLVDGVVPAARHSVQFDARNLASGTYIYRLVANNTVVTKTMVLLK
jgi:hypothetical protein